MSRLSEGNPGRALLFAAAAVAAVSLMCGLAAGQSSDNPQPKAEIFGGYSFYHPGLNVNGKSANLDSIPGGWGAAATWMFAHHVGLTGDFSGHYKTYNNLFGSMSASQKVHLGTIMFGPRLEARTGRLTPFAEALFGLHRIALPNSGINPNNAFGLGVGGGLDVHALPHLDIRLGQLDYIHSKHTYNFGSGTSSSTDFTFNSLRYQAGLNFLLGVAPPGPPPSASCSVQPDQVYAGEPITATARAYNFNPKRKLSYSWSASGGKISGTDTTARVDTTGLNPGNYTVSANITDGKKGQTSCQSSFTIKERPKNPPRISCSANPATVQTGTPSTISCDCSSPDNAPDYPVQASITNWTSSGGRISGSGNTATLDTTGASAGPITATATCTDSRGLTSTGRASVNVEVPPPPPQSSKLNEITFKRNSARVDNTAKAILDDVALRLQREADARLVIVGYQDVGEKGKNLAAERAANAKEYLTKEKGIDPSRIETRVSTAGGAMKDDIYLVPAGATFNEPNTEVSNVAASKAPYGRPAAARKPAAKKKAPAKKQ